MAAMPAGELIGGRTMSPRNLRWLVRGSVAAVPVEPSKVSGLEKVEGSKLLKRGLGRMGSGVLVMVRVMERVSRVGAKQVVSSHAW